MSKKLKLLDLCCKAGGASVGLAIAGFEVYGCDIENQPHYPYCLFQQDALEIPLDPFDAFWASPPCQGYIWGTRHGRENKFPMLVELIRQRLKTTGKPYIIELPVKKPLIDPIYLTGRMFGLGVIRKRYFECSFPILMPGGEWKKGGVKTGEFLTIAGHGGNSKSFKFKDWQKAMGIDWMEKHELVEAIPTVYAEFLGKAMLNHIKYSTKIMEVNNVRI